MNTTPVEELQRELCNTDSTCITPTTIAANTGNTCTLEGFQEQPGEKQEMSTLRSKSLAYMATKQVLKMEIILSKNLRLYYPRAQPPMIRVYQTCTTWNY